MFFDHYPYTNFHNINLDWVLQAVKAWGQTVEENGRAFRDLKEANEDFKRYVTNYLQDLDITDEINTKLDAMLASGVLTPYFAPYVKGYVDSWLASHVTPTSPALDSTLTLSGAAARADSTGKRLKDLAYVDALSTPEVIASLNRSQVLPGYRVQGIAYDYNGHYYVCGGSVDETGTGVIVKMTKPDFTDAEITEIPQLGHANDIAYYNGYLYVCTVGGGDAPRWGIYKINVNDFTDKTLISNAPENTIGISYRQGDFWLLAPYRIYRTTDFTSYEVVVGNTNDLLTAYGIPTESRISQTLFRAAGYLIGWVCSFVFEDRHYGALTFFNSTGEPIAFKMFPAYHSEIQGAVYADMSIYLLADGNMVNVFRMDPRHLSYVQLKAGDDLNSFTGRGTLYSTGSNVSAELLNSPSAGEGFTVQVDRLGVYNTIQTARTNSGRELYRIKSFNNDTWGEWIEPAAEVTQIKDDLDDISELEVTWITGKYIWKDGGVEVNGASYKCTDFIPVGEIRKPFVYRLRVFSNLATYALYDSKKRFIRSVSSASASLEIVENVILPLDANVAYIRFSTEYTSGNVVYVKTGNINNIAIGNKAVDNEKLGLKAVELGNVGDSVIVHDEQTNFIDMTAITNDYYVNSTGRLSSANDYNVTDYIPLESEKTYYMSNVLYTYYAFYDENKNFISSYSTLGNLYSPFTTPANTAYGRFSLNDTQLASDPWLNPTNARPDPYKLKINNENLNSYAVPVGTNVSNPCDYEGKEISVFNKICCIGDSITVGTFNHNEGGTEQYLVDTKYSYPTYLNKMFGVETVNWGLGGYTSVQWWNAKQNEDFSGFDSAIINLGINDALNRVSISDTETTLRSIISALKNANNGIKIFLATIVPAYADGVTTYDNVNDLIVDLAEEIENCYLVNLSEYSHVSKRSAYEAGHLTAIGYRMLAQDYAGYIGYIIRTNLTEFKWVQFIGTNYSRT